MADRKRKNRRQFWTTDEEDKIIEYKMEQVGFSNFGAFARKMLISGLIVKTDMSAFDNVADDIHGAAVNINQIAKKVNATGRITQEELARKLGSAREVISRLLSSLRRDGIIETQRGQIKIIKPFLLKELALK